jgi:anti-anti-sigma factor
MSLRVGAGGAGSSVVFVEGELDMATADQLTSSIELCAPLASLDLTLDLTQLLFLDVAGARTLLRIAEKMPMGSRLVVRGASGMALRTIELLRLEEHPALALRR